MHSAIMTTSHGERPKLKLLPRTKPLNGTHETKPLPQSQPQSSSSSSKLFGDGRAREEVLLSRIGDSRGGNVGSSSRAPPPGRIGTEGPGLGEKMEELCSALETVRVGGLADALRSGGDRGDHGDGDDQQRAKGPTPVALAEEIESVMALWNGHKGWNGRDARLAGRILLRMEQEEVLASGRPVPYDNYLSVINAYAKSAKDGDATAAVRAENVLDHMERRAADGSRPDLKPDRLSFNTAIGAHAKGASTGREAERLLSQMEREYAAGDATMKPTARSYSKVIDAYAREGDSRRAVLTLERMEARYRRAGDDSSDSCRPNTICYTSVIDALAKSARQDPNAAVRAEEILRSMLRIYGEGNNSDLKPDEKVFSAAIDAWSKSESRDAPRRALDILDLMSQYEVEADITTYNIVLNVLVLSGEEYFVRKAEAILDCIEKSQDIMADSFTYNTLMKGLSPQERERLLQHWEMEYKRGRILHRPDSFTYTGVMQAWGRSNIRGASLKVMDILGWMEQHDVKRMTSVCYNVALKALAWSHERGAGQKADSVYDRLVARYEKTGNSDFKPDKYTYCALINAWAGSGDEMAGERCEHYLREMISRRIMQKPDTRCFNTCINAWRNARSSSAPVQAKGLFNLMSEIGITPDTVCYNSLINVHEKCSGDGSAGKAMSVLQEMHLWG